MKNSLVASGWSHVRASGGPRGTSLSVFIVFSLTRTPVIGRLLAGISCDVCLDKAIFLKPVY
jgi:hypothetical protein